MRKRCLFLTRSDTNRDVHSTAKEFGQILEILVLTDKQGFVAKTKTLISHAIIVQHLCFRMKIMFFHDMAELCFALFAVHCEVAVGEGT